MRTRCTQALKCGVLVSVVLGSQQVGREREQARTPIIGASALLKAHVSLPATDVDLYAAEAALKAATAVGVPAEEIEVCMCLPPTRLHPDRASSPTPAFHSFPPRLTPLRTYRPYPLPASPLTPHSCLLSSEREPPAAGGERGARPSGLARLGAGAPHRQRPSHRAATPLAAQGPTRRGQESRRARAAARGSGSAAGTPTARVTRGAASSRGRAPSGRSAAPRTERHEVSSGGGHFGFTTRGGQGTRRHAAQSHARRGFLLWRAYMRSHMDQL